MALVLSSHVCPLDKFTMYWAEEGRGNLDAGVFLRKGSACSPPSPGLNPNCGGGHGETNKKRCLRDLKTEPIYALLSR